jgi:SAM-dependent methyltransferase
MPILPVRPYHVSALAAWSWGVLSGRVRPSRDTLRATIQERRRRSPPRPYPLATRYLHGLEGVEIGGSAQNPFLVKALNFDRFPSTDTIYKREEQALTGRYLNVDVAALGDQLPLRDRSVDFVLASHVIEHFPDPIRALREWQRVARRYVFLLVPHRNRTFDRDRSLTTVDELLERHASGFTSTEDRHWSVWTCETFVELCHRFGVKVVATEDPDRKVGNGFAVVIDTREERAPP